MRKTEYIVVGLGIAGITACERLEMLGKDFVVFDTGKRTATKIAGGVVNPIVLKRLTPVWKARQFIEEAKGFYRLLQAKLTTTFIDDIPLYRILNTVEEQNNWTIASDSPVLSSFISSEISMNTNPHINASLGFGEVRESFRINTETLLNSYRKYLLKTNRLIDEPFNYEELNLRDEGVHFRNIETANVLFSEGSGVINNPYLPPKCLLPKKGEYIIFKAPTLKLNAILKGTYFIIPLGDDLYQAGATFAHGDTTFDITETGKEQLVTAISKMITCDFEITDQITGMRPTVKDRRPVLGNTFSDRLLFFNGLGTRGLLMAPLLSKWLLDYAEKGEPLPPEVNIARFL